METDLTTRPEPAATDAHLRFASLYARYRPAVLRLATLTLGDTDEAQDVVQSVFATLWEQRDRIDRIVSLDAYLYRMTKNTLFNHLKHRAIVRRYEQEPTETPLSDPASTADLMAFIKQAIDEMPPQRRRVFCMSRFEDLSYEEISDQLHISIRTVQYHVSAALAQLRKTISESKLMW